MAAVTVAALGRVTEDTRGGVRTDSRVLAVRGSASGGAALAAPLRRSAGGHAVESSSRSRSVEWVGGEDIVV